MINVYDDILSHPNYFKQLSFKEILLVNYQCPQMESWVDLYSHFNHIIYTVSGKKILNTPGKTHILEEGSLVFLKKGAIKQGRFFDSDWVVIVFCVPDSYLQQLLKEYRSQTKVQSVISPSTDAVINIKASNTTHSYFYSLLPYFTQQPPPPETLLELKCRELIFNIFSSPENAGILSYLNSVSDLTKPMLSEVMEANYTYNLSLEEFARISQRSLTAFKTEFSETFNTTPGKWLVQRRLQYAQMLLSISPKNINEIVYESGFESPTHFSRVFKLKFGMAPLQYRRHFETSNKAEL
jgi:AraC-like DNA-binding protein